MTEAKKKPAGALEEAVSRAVRDNLPPLQRSLEDLQQAFADLVSSCASARPTNALPAMLRAQSTSAALTASLQTLSSFIAAVMQKREEEIEDAEVTLIGTTRTHAPAEEELPPPQIPTPMAQQQAGELVLPEADSETVEEEPIPAGPVRPGEQATSHASAASQEVASETESPSSEAKEAEFDVNTLPPAERDLHRRANRVAKVSMQDIKMLKPDEVRRGRENKDICIRLRSEIDKARKEYDRRFQKILDHPVDYFYHWTVEVLGGGDPETLGKYPYPSPVSRR